MNIFLHFGYILIISVWRDNDNHDLHQSVIGTVKSRDDINVNKYRSIIILSILVSDIVSICICHYVQFPFLLLHAASL